LNTFFWNINFWESSSSFSADVENPAKNYPRGMALAVMLVFLSLLLPILVAIGASPDTDNFEKWTDGYFVHLAIDIVGPWLGYWMTFAAMITNIGMFEAEMSSDAWQVAGMADKGILPSFLSTRNAHGSPTYGVLLSALGVVALGWLAFGEVIEMLNLVYCYGQLIEFAAYIQLRWQQDRRSRSSHEPVIKFYFSTEIMMALLFLPVVFIFVILWFSSLTTFLLSIGLAVAGPLMFHLLNYLKEHKCCHFNDWD
jgi:amino acid transporter